MNIKWVLTVAAAMLLFISGFVKSEPDEVLWKYNADFHSYPAVHPNGNVLIRSHYDVLEINGLTGELIRRIYVPVAGEDHDIIGISQDGTRFMVRGCLVDYESGEVLKQGLRYLMYSFLNPYNDKVIYVKNDLTIEIINLNDDSKTEYEVSVQGLSITAFALSKDGKYFAIAREDFVDEPNTYIDIFDAKTLKPIRQLEKAKAEGNKTIEFIQFSENAKYVGYGHYTVGNFKSTFFECEPPYKKWEFNKEKMPPDGMLSVCFINDKYAYLTNIGSSIIYDIQQDKTIYFTDKYVASYYPLYNKTYNSIINKGNSLFAVDLNKILTSVEVTENENSFSAEYQKGKLILIGLNSITSNSGLKIFDLQGKLIFSFPLILVQSDKTEIPLILKSGIYIVSINDGIKEYSQKFMVTE